VGRSEELRLLRGRWQVTDVKPAVVRAREALLVGGSVVSPFPKVTGRVDLRGLPFSGSVAHWRDRTPRLAAGSDRSRGRSIAPRAAWQGRQVCGAGGVDVAACSMRRTRLFHGQLGAPAPYWPRRSQWRDVDLRQADLRVATASLLFQDIDFRNAKFRSTDLGWSDLRSCQFAGVVLGLKIGHMPIPEQPPGWLLSEVDFTAATLRDLELVGVSLPSADIRLPNDADHWPIPDWPDYLQRLASAVAQLPECDLKLAASVWLDVAIRDLGAGQTAGFIAAWDLTHLGGNELRDLLGQIRRKVPGLAPPQTG
jgi:uncharacterized protein YjbI with pentapeptide repeats